MTLFHTMTNTIQDEKTLQDFILQNIQHFHNISNASYSELIDERDDIRNFIETKSVLLEGINYKLSETKAFISILFDFCEMFGFLSTTRIENTLNKREIYVGKRREASKLFLLNLKHNTDYTDRFVTICDLINEAIEEEATDLRTVITFANYFLKVLRDAGPANIAELKRLITEYKDTYPFLNHPLISDIYKVDLVDIESVENKIITIVEDYQIRFVYPRGTGAIALLIESETDYADEIELIDISLDEIRDITVSKLAGKSTNLKGRGVLPLETSDELLIYMYRYGRMHKAKLISALENISFQDITNPVEIIDWGCGQGIASLILKEYLRDNGIDLDIKSVTLIEPSELTLKRASLHAHNIYASTATIKTICKDFDSLIAYDVSSNVETTKIHLFSNILDLNENFFSHDNLIKLIEKTQKGDNYFICVSPYQSDDEVDRLDGFKRYFSQSVPTTFNNIFEAANTTSTSDPYWNCNNNYKGKRGVYCSHKPNGCNYQWSRFIRVFKVVL